MATSTGDFDRLLDSLADELGSETEMLLSAQGDTRPVLGFEALPAFAAGLVGYFVAGFVAGISKQLISAASDLGKKQAEKLKEALNKMQAARQASQEEQRKAIAAGRDAVQEAASQPDLVAASKEAARAGQAEVAAQLVALGMDAAEAREKAEKVVQLVLGTLRP